ncbi:MAG TPA: shikimate kinase [Rhodanobacteraceae bacterium]|nr:shikimate kinase [Rhodanobacteraceae bacterium]
MNPSANLFLVGPTGAGKTTIGRRVAELLQLPFVDLDQAVEQRCGVSVALIFELEGEEGFRRRESALLQECSQAKGLVLATGAGAVLDADNRRLLRERGFVVWLQADVAQQLARLERDRRRPLLAAADREQRLQRMAEQRNPLYAEVADLAVQPENDAVVPAARELATRLQHHWRRSAAPAAAQAGAEALS